MKLEATNKSISVNSMGSESVGAASPIPELKAGSRNRVKPPSTSISRNAGNIKTWGTVRLTQMGGKTFRANADSKIHLSS